MAIFVVVYPRWECKKKGRQWEVRSLERKQRVYKLSTWRFMDSSMENLVIEVFAATLPSLLERSCSQTILVRMRFGTSLWFPIPQWHDRKDMQISSTKLFPRLPSPPPSSAAGNFIPKIRRDIFKELSLSVFWLTSWHCLMQTEDLRRCFKIHSTFRAQRPRTCFNTLSMRLWLVVQRQGMHV